MAQAKKGEYLYSETATKKVYHFSDGENVDVISREIFKKKALEIHYPFNPEGGQKYKFIESIEFHGLSPSVVNGIYKVATFGFGFTRYLRPIVYFLEDYPRISKIVISATQASKMEAAKITFSKSDIYDVFNWIKPLKESQSVELKRTANNAMASVFANKIKHDAEAYTKGSLSHFVKNKQVTSDKLSKEDVGEVLKLIPDQIPEESLLYKAEEKINFVKLKAVKSALKRLVNQRQDTKSLEERCQKFFEKNAWILSNVLSMPVALLKSKAYVGGKTYENQGGKIVDFLYKNGLTKNVYLIEIKTPRKKLIDGRKAYRKPDVFSLGKELTGGLVQVLDQKDTLQKNFANVADSKYESFAPKAMLLIGCLSDLNKYQKQSFELFRNNIKDVEIVTFDELLERTELVLGQFVAK